MSDHSSQQAVPDEGAASPRSPITNWEPAGDGHVRAICQWCDHRSDPIQARPDGRPTWALGNGWSSAPYPVNFQHPDGSHGPLYTCPFCRALGDDRQRLGISPLLSPAPARAAARLARQGAL